MTILGADATQPASNSLLSLSAKLLRAQPAFFGRYFKGPHNPSSIQYQASLENPVLAAAKVRLLCIGRQTLRVGGSFADGVSDGVNNLSAVVSALGADYLASLAFSPIIFLDVEPSNPLGLDYSQGWSGALANQGPSVGAHRLTFTPALYVNTSDATTWSVVDKALAEGMVCAGAWVANYGKRTGAEGPPAWDEGAIAPKASTKCRIVGWQYAGDYEDVLDFSELAPDAEDIFALMPQPSV